MKKIVILGSSGSGKSTLAIKLGEKLNISPTFLDCFAFDNNWNQTNYKKIDEIICETLKKDQYILDGNFLNCVHKRFDDADTIIFINTKPIHNLNNALHRFQKYKNKTRISRPSCVNEKINIKYINWILFGFRRKSKPIIKDILKEHQDKNIIVLKNNLQIKNFIESINQKEEFI